jgi:hypothetical protein
MSLPRSSLPPHDAEKWRYGPVLEIQAKLAQRRLDDLSYEEARFLLSCLGIHRVSPNTAFNTSTAEADDWRLRDLNYALWQLPGCEEVGVKLLPTRRHRVYDLLLAVPPTLAKAAIGSFPWSGHNWCTEAVAAFHAELVRRFRLVHASIGLKAVLVQDESWTYSLRESDRGILISQKVAMLNRWSGTQREGLVTVPLV